MESLRSRGTFFTYIRPDYTDAIITAEYFMKVPTDSVYLHTKAEGKLSVVR